MRHRTFAGVLLVSAAAATVTIVAAAPSWPQWAQNA